MNKKKSIVALLLMLCVFAANQLFANEAENMAFGEEVSTRTVKFHVTGMT